MVGPMAQKEEPMSVVADLHSKELTTNDMDGDANRTVEGEQGPRCFLVDNNTDR